MNLFTYCIGLNSIRWTFLQWVLRPALREKMDIAFSISIYFCFTYKTSNYEDSVLKISILKLSNKFPISSFVTTPVDVLRVQIPCLCLATLPEHLMHNSHMVSNYCFDISPFPTTLKISKDSCLSAWRKIIFRMSSSRSLFLDLCKLYLKCSTKSSMFSSYFCVILNIYSLTYQDLQ